MANETTEANTTKTAMVELFVPRGVSVDEPNVLVSVNGKNWVLPKGKTSKVPAYVKYEYERAIRAKESMDVRAAEMAEKAAEQEKHPVGAL
jgi:hypothetical protein